jgi:hypothetical protein
MVQFCASVVTSDDPVFSPRKIDNALGLTTRGGEMLAVLADVPWLIVELRPLPVVSSSMKVEIYCFTPPDTLLRLTYVTCLKRRHIGSTGKIEICVLIFRGSLPLLSSVDSGNLGLHKGRHLVEFA